MKIFSWIFFPLKNIKFSLLSTNCHRNTASLCHHNPIGIVLPLLRYLYAVIISIQNVSLLIVCMFCYALDFLLLRVRYALFYAFNMRSCYMFAMRSKHTLSMLLTGRLLWIEVERGKEKKYCGWPSRDESATTNPLRSCYMINTLATCSL